MALAWGIGVGVYCTHGLSGMGLEGTVMASVCPPICSPYCLADVPHVHRSLLLHDYRDTQT